MSHPPPSKRPPENPADFFELQQILRGVDVFWALFRLALFIAFISTCLWAGAHFDAEVRPVLAGWVR